MPARAAVWCWGEKINKINLFAGKRRNKIRKEVVWRREKRWCRTARLPGHWRAATTLKKFCLVGLISEGINLFFWERHTHRVTGQKTLSTRFWHVGRNITTNDQVWKKTKQNFDSFRLRLSVNLCLWKNATLVRLVQTSSCLTCYSLKIPKARQQDEEQLQINRWHHTSCLSDGQWVSKGPILLLQKGKLNTTSKMVSYTVEVNETICIRKGCEIFSWSLAAILRISFSKKSSSTSRK